MKKQTAPGLAYWKGRLNQIKEIIKEYTLAKHFAKRRIEQLERQVLKSKTLIWLAVLCYLAMITGCATMSGFGEDVTAISNGLARSAVEHNK